MKYRKSPEKAARNAEIVAYYLAGHSQQECGDRFGITRSAVSLILKAQGLNPAEISKMRTELGRGYREAQKKAERLRTPLQMAPCVVCRKRFNAARRPGAGNRTCSHACSAAWPILRRYLDPVEYDAHRLANARTVLRYPEKRKAVEIELAHKIVNGTAPTPNRGYIVRGSKTHLTAIAVGREDILVGRLSPEKKGQQ